MSTSASNIEEEVTNSFELTNQMVNSQIKLIQTYPYVEVRPERKLSLFKLEQFNDIRFITIELFDADGQRIGINKDPNKITTDVWLELIKPVLNIGFREAIPSTSRRIDVGAMHLGEIVVSPDTDAKLRVLWQEVVATLTPVMVLFAIIMFSLTLVNSFIIQPVIEFLRAVSSQRTSKRVHAYSASWLNHLIRLPFHLQRIRHELRDSSQKVDELNTKILNLQEEERRRLSAELHDELGQHLTAIRFESEVIRTAKNLADTQQSAESIDIIGRQMKDIIRSLIERLRPPELDELGLHGALNEMISSWKIRYPHVTTVFNYDSSLSIKNDTNQLSIYRIIQEALTNISRHAGEHEIDVIIDVMSSDDQVTIMVSDNGVGCDLSKPVLGFGLKGMRDRVDSLAGVMTIISSPGKGMKIIVDVPIEIEKNK